MALHVAYELLRDDVPPECITDIARSGRNDDAVEHWRTRLGFTVDRLRAIACLRGYGAWDDLDTTDDDTLARRVLWLAAWNFREGDDVFVLEG